VQLVQMSPLYEVKTAEKGQLSTYMATGQLLGWGVGGLEKIVDTIFNALFFSKKNKLLFYYFIKI
jgi:hypothetical protein